MFLFLLITLTDYGIDFTLKKKRKPQTRDSNSPSHTDELQLHKTTHNVCIYGTAYGIF